MFPESLPASVKHLQQVLRAQDNEPATKLQLLAPARFDNENREGHFTLAHGLEMQMYSLISSKQGGPSHVPSHQHEEPQAKWTHGF